MKKTTKKNSVRGKGLACAVLLAAFIISAYGCGDSAFDGDYDAMAPAAAEKTAGAPTEGIAAGEPAADVFNGVDMGETAVEEDFSEGEYDDSFSADGPAEKSTIDESMYKDLPEAGQLTAGEWNDNENWGFFSNLVNSGTISFPSFGIDPTHRIAVTVKGSDGSPLVNAKANLLDKENNILWSGITDKEGIVYLFAQNDSQAAYVEIESGGKKQLFELNASQSNGQSVKAAENNDLEITFDGSGKLFKAMDIMFIVDTTGSMSDEMLFLQSEFSAITEEIGTNSIRYSVNFYRDEGDDYVTKCNDFTSDTKKIQKLLNKEDANGGGDYPEAVAEALNETMFSKDWNEESVKLAFLIFDAPPHIEKEQQLTEAVREAAKKGIRLIPVVASDSDRDTELFGRAIAITTGGTYVFLTDDSGIGNSHEEPIIGSHEVKPLYNTIIDIVNTYKQ